MKPAWSFSPRRPTHVTNWQWKEKGTNLPGEDSDGDVTDLTVTGLANQIELPLRWLQEGFEDAKKERAAGIEEQWKPQRTNKAMFGVELNRGDCIGSPKMSDSVSISSLGSQSWVIAFLWTLKEAGGALENLTSACAAMKKGKLLGGN